MTGYGRGTSEHDGYRVVVEIRSVNHRYIDLKLRGSSLPPSVEERVSSLVRKRVQRGAITVTIRVDSRASGGADSTGMQIDFDVARRVFRQFDDLARELRMTREVPLELVCAQPGVIVVADRTEDPESLTACVQEAVTAALDGLMEMRDAEGAALARDLEGRLDHVVAIVDQLDGLVATMPAEIQRRLHERLEELLAANGKEVDPDRLAHEVALLADRHDVTEELVRLRSHVEQARAVIHGVERSKTKSAGKPMGRRLGFLVQEFGREFNTVGSKSQSSDIAAAVVEAKAELEKMREQVQNIE